MAILTRLSSAESGLALIRLGLGSYFLAIATGVIDGVQPGAALAFVLPDDSATLCGTAALLGASVMLMMGMRLAVASVALAGLILSASLAQNLPGAAPGGMQDISALWRDIVLVCALILTQQATRLTGIAPELAHDLTHDPDPVRETDAKAELALPDEAQPDAERVIESGKPPCPMPRRVADIGKARTPRPNLPKLRKLTLDQGAPAAPTGAMADADTCPDVVPRKLRAKTTRERFKRLPLTSPYDHPHENIFAQV